MKLIYLGIKGHLKALFNEDDGQSIVIIAGDSKGLLSPARMITKLARTDQKQLKTLPARFACEHIHLEPKVHLAQNSVRLSLDRADDKAGKLDPTFKKRKKMNSHPIIHYW